ncbi:MAG: VWA domain-containing protein [Ignavibacteriae bacterium]|nr:VWA domain-containing protein [Ignavibacteriota bacterium]
MKTKQNRNSKREFRNPKTLLWLLAVVVLGIILQSQEALTHQRTGEITLNGRLNTTCIPHSGGTVYLQMEIITPASTKRSERRPMNIAVVLDRSGSMADERKIDYAKQAVFSLIDRLSSDDYLSIVIYDDQIDVLLPTQRVRDKQRIKRMIREVYPRGSTNLGGGMMEGFRQVERNLNREFVNRVILLSDGLANQGITDPHELNRIAQLYRNKSISLSTMGVGLDYNENLMLGLAEHGGGNYYFIESPRQLALIFKKELHGLVSIVAQNARIELTLGKGVTLNDVIGCEWNRDGNKWIIPVGDLYSNESREFTVELSIPEGSGTKRVASGVLRYDGDKGWFGRHPSFSVDIHYTDDVAELDKGKDWDTQAKVDVALSTRQVARAIQFYESGNREDAEKELNEAKLFLQSSPALSNSAQMAPMIQEQIMQLEGYADSVKDESADARKVKKSLQYGNYKTQKKKN